MVHKFVADSYPLERNSLKIWWKNNVKRHMSGIINTLKSQAFLFYLKNSFLIYKCADNGAPLLLYLENPFLI